MDNTPQIAVIDDRSDQGSILAKRLHLKVHPSGWRAVFHDPLEKLADYPVWIRENGVWALVVDWKLSRTGTSSGHRGVEYDANALVDVVREEFPYFPIYVVTTYASGATEEQWLGRVDDFEDRDKFSRDLKVYAPRILRLAKQFRRDHLEHLATITAFSNRSARGETLSDDEVRQLHAAQAAVQLGPSRQLPDHLLDALNDADELRRDIERRLEDLEKRASKVQ